MADPFRVALTRDFLTPDGRVGWGDIGLDRLDAADGVAWEFLPDDHTELPPGSLDGYDALICLGPRIGAETVRGATALRVIARFGVGYDSVDVDACTAAGVPLVITPDGVRRPVATSAVALVLALAHRLPQKDRLVRENRWQDKLDHMGHGLTGATVGFVGWGNIGRETTTLLAPFGVRVLAADPYADAAAASAAGVELTGLDDLLRRSGFVIVTCALTDATRGLLDADRLALLRPDAFLVNVARGPVVDQAALTTVLQEHRIAGAALDVFEQEPPTPDDPLLALDDVILAPHAVAWTDELALGIGTSAIGGVLEVAAHRRPPYVVNPAAFEQPRGREWFTEPAGDEPAHAERTG